MNCAAMRAKRLGENGNRALPSSTASRSRPRKRGRTATMLQEDQWPQTPSARRCSWVGACCRRPSGDVQDRDGARLVLALLRHTFTRLRLIWADGGYAGQLLGWVRNLRGRNRLKMKSSNEPTMSEGSRCSRADGCRAHLRLAWAAAPSQQGLRVPTCHERDHHLHHDDRPHDSQTGSRVGLVAPTKHRAGCNGYPPLGKSTSPQPLSGTERGAGSIVEKQPSVPCRR